MRKHLGKPPKKNSTRLQLTILHQINESASRSTGSLENCPRLIGTTKTNKQPTSPLDSVQSHDTFTFTGMLRDSALTFSWRPAQTQELDLWKQFDRRTWEQILLAVLQLLADTHRYLGSRAAIGADIIPS